MIPNIYTHEKLVIEHRYQLLREAEHKRMLAMAKTRFSCETLREEVRNAQASSLKKIYFIS